MKISTAPIGAAIVAALAMSAAGLSGQQPGQQPQTQQTQAQQQPQTLTGEVVSRTGDMVTIRTDGGETRIVVIDAQSRIMGPTGVLTAQPRQQRIDALRAGERVTVQYRPGTMADQFVLVELRPAQGQTQQQAQTPQAQPTPVAPAPGAPAGPAAGQSAQAQAPARLPQTAGQLPAVAVLGLLSLIGAAGVHAATRSRGRKDEV
jgi:hypothetical protein